MIINGSDVAAALDELVAPCSSAITGDKFCVKCYSPLQMLLAQTVYKYYYDPMFGGVDPAPTGGSSALGASMLVMGEPVGAGNVLTRTGHSVMDQVTRSTCGCGMTMIDYMAHMGM